MVRPPINSTMVGSTGNDYIYKAPPADTSAPPAQVKRVALDEVGTLSQGKQTNSSSTQSKINGSSDAFFVKGKEGDGSGARPASAGDMVKIVAKFIDSPATAFAEAITATKKTSPDKAPAAAAAPAPAPAPAAAAAAPSYTTAEVSAASGAPAVGAPARKDYVAVMETSTDIVAETKSSDSSTTTTMIVLGVAAAGIAYYMYSNSKKSYR